MHCLKPLAVALAAAFSTHALAAGNTLVGWARMAPDTFADGPTSGQMTRGNAYGTYLPPYEHRQPVQGFSALKCASSSNPPRFSGVSLTGSPSSTQKAN